MKVAKVMDFIGHKNSDNILFMYCSFSRLKGSIRRFGSCVCIGQNIQPPRIPIIYNAMRVFIIASRTLDSYLKLLRKLDPLAREIVCVVFLMRPIYSCVRMLAPNCRFYLHFSR